MTSEEKVAYINGQTAIFNARIAGMVAENTHQMNCGNGIAYGEEAFEKQIADIEFVLGCNAIVSFFRAEQAETARRAACYDDLLAALGEVCRTLESDNPAIIDTIWIESGQPETLLDHCRAAIAKAEGVKS